MSKRKSVIVVRSDSAKVAAQISTTTNVPVRQVNREELKVDWEKCFICQTETGHYTAHQKHDRMILPKLIVTLVNAY